MLTTAIFMATSVWAKYDYLECKMGVNIDKSLYGSPKIFWLKLYDEEELNYYNEWSKNSFITDSTRLLTKKIELIGNNYRYMGIAGFQLDKFDLSLKNLDGDIKGLCKVIEKESYESRLESRRSKATARFKDNLKLK